MPGARRIDVHFHFIPQFYQDAVYAAGTGPAIGRYPDWSPELALQLMDQFEIELAMNSLAQPGVQFGSPESGRALARRCNEYAAELSVKFPGRFGGFGLVPLFNTDDAVAEIEHCLDTLKLEGICLFASYGGKFLGDAFFNPVFDALNRRDAVVFVHPALHPSSRTLDLPWPGFMMEYLFDTTRAVVNLIFSGALDRYPRIRFILAHAGGLAPYFAWRLSVSPMIDPRLPQLSREAVFAAFDRFWYDNALSPGEITMGALTQLVSRDRILFGSDWPFCNTGVVAEMVKSHTAAGLHTDAQRAAIDRGNSLKVWPQFS